MTTGTYGDTLPGPITLGVGFRRTWSGTDGKITTYAGTQRDKWNNYTCQVDSWFRTSTEFVVKILDVYYDNSVAPSIQTYNPGFGFSSPLTFSSNDQLRLLQRLLQKVKSHDFNLAVNLGQLHQTVDLLVGNLRKLGLAAIALKRGQFVTAARQLGAKPRGTRLKTTDISGRWLELQYGWLPLLGDSFEAAKAFEAISDGPRSQTFRTSIKKEIIGNGCQSPTIFEMPYRERLSRYIQYECVEEMGFARQLGLLDPLSVAWELLPWSFVVDWFIPIGSYIDLVNQIPALKGRFLTTDVNKRETIGKCGLHPSTVWTGPGFPYRRQIAGVLKVPAVRQKQVTVNRVYSDSLSVPLPNMHLGGAVHGRRLWNAISLTQQRFSRALDAELNAASLARVVRTRYRSRRGRPGI